MLMTQALDDESHLLWSSILRRPSRSGDTGGEAALQFTRSELKNCRDNHPECNLNEAGWGLPTRVLDLGETQNEFTSDIKLYVTQNETETYVCLSYCWGSEMGSKPLETTVERLHRFQLSISYEILPKTFQDAVVFTRKLGYRFLWIDSLCIIQDDSEDWLREAGRMASIYENAVLTLAAASSQDTKGGLFRESTPGVALGHSNQGKIQPALRRFSNPAFFEYGRLQPVRERSRSEEISPLMKRAWIYQERMLSGRVLFFTPLELVFECRVSNTTESGYPWIDSRPKHAFTSVYNQKCSKDLLLMLWRKMVTEYTQLLLTLNKDKLSAIAGIATRLFKRLDEGHSMSYFAGSWKETFIEDMLWEPSSRIVNNPPRVNECIPTWSWARSDRPKTYNKGDKDMKALCQLEEAACMPLGSSNNVFTGVSSGYAVLSGYLLPAKMTETGIVIDKNPRVCHLPERDYDWNTDGPEKISDGDEIFILPLMSSQKTEHEIQVHALVLRRCSSDDAFKRIGIFGLPISAHYLEGHQYIFEGTDVCLEMYRKLVMYGKSLLGQDGLYQTSEEERSANPRWLSPEAENLRSDFFMQAQYRHLCMYGPKSKEDLKAFLGQTHVDVLEAAMNDERDRVEEWERRNERGDEQEHNRTLIKLL
ncbi:HET-domain-containing protein [Penicillium odoratum]|uniref:HET-domain-containing protein n=1 Tax=Penicillium odoratum TaxID=1167516 RepID=UPI0025495D65|nr:HET-domain-containing protein [Penicillium odoratum]KAJ5745270.1 HET-domain-containing protein [Penicillium odoratum]